MIKIHKYINLHFIHKTKLSESESADPIISVLLIFFHSNFVVSVLHSAHTAGLWERWRDFDFKLWQTVRRSPDSPVNSLQLHWLRHQQLHPAGCGAQGLCQHHTATTDQLDNKHVFDVGVCHWGVNLNNIFTAQLHYYSSQCCGVPVLDPSRSWLGALEVHFWGLFFGGCFKLQSSMWSSTECPVTHEGTQWGHASCKRCS